MIVTRTPPRGSFDIDPLTGLHQQGRGFRVATAVSSEKETRAAVQDIAAQMRVDQLGAPDFVTVHYGGARPAQDVWDNAASVFGTGAMHGGSSCLGVMSAKGAAIGDGASIGAFAIWDSAGAYGTGSASLDEDPRAAAAAATRAALSHAGRMGEAPELVWLTSAPGTEEHVLAGIKDVIGQAALIVGGSSADNDVTGQWSQMTAQGVHARAVVVSVLFPSVPIGCFFESGYAPTPTQGVITRAVGRTVHEIDGRPAAHVYSEWTGGHVPVPATGSLSVLAESTMYPLGRKLTEIDGIPFHMLAHPAVAHADGRLEIFADLAQGQQVCLMTGTEDSLIERAGRIAACARDQLTGPISGALMIYCGGCMLSVTGRMSEVATNVDQALSGVPFLGIFTFGEQGETLCGESEHGNLMISCITFGSSSAWQ